MGGAVSLCTTLLVERQKRIGASEEEKRRALASGKLAARVVTLELRDETQAAIDALEGWGATTMVAAPGQSDES